MLRRSLILLMVVACGAGCSTHYAHVDYREYTDIALRPDRPAHGRPLGYVTGEAGGFAWSDCRSRVRESIEELIRHAQDRGANAVGDVRWDASEGFEASCKRGWLYTVLWPFLLTPMFMTVRVEGLAYHVPTVR